MKNGIDKYEARKISGISWAYFYKATRKTTEATDYLQQYSPKGKELVKLAYTRLKCILKDTGAKHSDTISAIKIVLDRSHPINEPLAQQNQQFIQINVQALDKAVQAINSLQVTKIVTSDAASDNSLCMKNHTLDAVDV